MTTLPYFAGKIRKKWVRVWGVLKAGRLTIYDCEPGGAVMPVEKAAIEMAEVRCSLATPQPHTRAPRAYLSLDCDSCPVLVFASVMMITMSCSLSSSSPPPFARSSTLCDAPFDPSTVEKAGAEAALMLEITKVSGETLQYQVDMQMSLNAWLKALQAASALTATPS